MKKTLLLLNKPLLLQFLYLLNTYVSPALYPELLGNGDVKTCPCLSLQLIPDYSTLLSSHSGRLSCCHLSKSVPNLSHLSQLSAVCTNQNLRCPHVAVEP